MGKRLVVLISLAAVFTAWTACYGAHLLQISSGLSAEVDAYAKDSTGSAGPGVVSAYDANSLAIFQEFYTAYTYASGEAYGDVDEYGGPLGVDVSVGGYPWIDTLDALPDSWAYAECETRQPGVTNGIFFRIEPDVNENVGDDIIVNFSWAGYADVFGQGWCDIGGTSGMDHMAITLNQNPPVTGVPDSQYEVWTHPNVHETVYYEDANSGSFDAIIGDVIGVFISVDTRSELTSGEYAYVDGYSIVSLWLDDGSYCPADINDDGRVDFEDFAIFAQYWLWTRE
ncbi:MAG: hypothetical protein ACYS83_11020 [Planctomycetota bacterium]|jgi:hypothetical protein